MSRTTRTLRGAGWATWARPAVVLGLALPAGLLLGAPSAAAADDDGLRLEVLRCQGGACLSYLATVDDSDGDGVSDDDERAAGTDPYDAASVPPVLDTLELGLLPSVERGLAEIVVLPAQTPDGQDLEAFSALAAVPLDTRADALTRLGISSDLLAQHGLGTDSTLAVMVQQGTKGEAPPVEARVGGINASHISTLQPVYSMGEPGTATVTGPDGSRSTAESQSFTTLQPSLEEITTNITGSVTRDANGTIINVTHTVTTTTTDWTEENPKPVPSGSYCTSSSSSGCTQPTPEQKKAEEEAKKKADEESRKKAEEEAKKKAEEEAKKSEEERKKAEEEAKKKAEEEKKKKYINPDAEFTVVVTHADIERVVALKGGATTTPVQDAPQLPELDLDVLVDELDLIGYWEGPREQVIPEPLPEPTRSPDQVTTYVPGFEPPIAGELPPVPSDDGTGWRP
jgi:hypothetical protein